MTIATNKYWQKIKKIHHFQNSACNKSGKWQLKIYSFDDFGFLILPFWLKSLRFEFFTDSVFWLFNHFLTNDCAQHWLKTAQSSANHNFVRIMITPINFYPPIYIWYHIPEDVIRTLFLNSVDNLLFVLTVNCLSAIIYIKRSYGADNFSMILKDTRYYLQVEYILSTIDMLSAGNETGFFPYKYN